MAPAAAVTAAAQTVPGFAADLRLDVLAATSPALGEKLYTPLPDPAAVANRQAAFRDLESPGLLASATSFVAAMTDVRSHLARAAAIAHRPERARWHLEAMAVYRGAVDGLLAALDEAPLVSADLIATRDALRDLVASPAFAALAADTDRMLADLAAVQYGMRIEEDRVVVRRTDEGDDYIAEVHATFARLWPDEATAPPPVPVDIFEATALDRVQRAILGQVVRRHPAIFRSLDDFVARTRDAVDPAVVALADELRFYLDWLAVLAPLRAAGLDICYPVVSVDGPPLEVRGLVDTELAGRLVAGGRPVIASDLAMDEAERLVVVTGPNQGGKTTFARAIGQLVHLASVGVPVPATAARVRLVDAVHTLFARAEDPSELTGRLEAELVRARAILDVLRPDSVVILNDAFNSTTADDALALDRELLHEIRGVGATAVVVTFLGELASFDAATVSVTCVEDPSEPTRPTYRLERGPADPLAHARAMARAHGLDRASVTRRVVGRGTDPGPGPEPG
jgi:DNA mismatch repair protein MutS